MNAPIVAGAALLIWVLGLSQYTWAIARRGAPRFPVGPAMSVFGGGGLSLVALALALARGGEDRVAVVALTSLPVLTAPLLLWLHAQRRTPAGRIRVKVGEPLLAFTAQSTDGAPFSSNRLAGRRVLLKFYRGEWCPFCQAELRAWSAMAPALRRYGVSIYALSKDPPEVARAHGERDGLDLTLLCDPGLEVIRRYGLEHQKALQMAKGPRLRLLGMVVGTRPERVSMAVPTTVLVDEHGVVRWVDQAEDYKVRSAAERVFQEVVRVFGGPGDATATPALPCDPRVDPDCVAC